MKYFWRHITSFFALLVIASACSPKTENLILYNTSTNGVPRLTVFPTDVAGIAQLTPKRGTGTNAEFIIQLRFTDAKAEMFRKFTSEHRNQKVQLMVGAHVVAEPFIAAEITNGMADLTFSSAADADAVASLLTQPIYSKTGGGKARNQAQPASPQTNR